LPDLAQFDDTPRTLAHALDQFATMKTMRYMPDERRVLMGETLIVRYVEADQEPDVA
jgi:hypothetical protein